MCIYAIMYIDKGKRLTHKPQKGLIELTIKQMKNIAKETMNTELSYLSGDEYRDYCDLIRQTENERISY